MDKQSLQKLLPVCCMKLTCPEHAVQVSVRILGGLMALGYEIGSILKRTSTLFTQGSMSVKLDVIEGMEQSYVQVLLHHLMIAMIMLLL